MPSKVWDKITYPFPNFNGATLEVWEWVSNFIPHFIMGLITYPCWDLSWSMLVKGAPGVYFIKLPMLNWAHQWQADIMLAMGLTYNTVQLAWCIFDNFFVLNSCNTRLQSWMFPDKLTTWLKSLMFPDILTTWLKSSTIINKLFFNLLRGTTPLCCCSSNKCLEVIILLTFHSLAHGRYEWNFRLSNFDANFGDWWLRWLVKTTLRWMSLDLTEDQQTLAQVMAWCRQAPSHYLSQFWLILCHQIVSLGHNVLNKPSNGLSNYFHHFCS